MLSWHVGMNFPTKQSWQLNSGVKRSRGSSRSGDAPSVTESGVNYQLDNRGFYDGAIPSCVSNRPRVEPTKKDVCIGVCEYNGWVGSPSHIHAASKTPVGSAFTVDSKHYSCSVSSGYDKQWMYYWYACAKTELIILHERQNSTNLSSSAGRT